MLSLFKSDFPSPPPRPFDRLRTGSPIKGEEHISDPADFPSLGGRG
jgi:hypothetical protein